MRMQLAGEQHGTTVYKRARLSRERLSRTRQYIEQRERLSRTEGNKEYIGIEIEERRGREENEIEA